MTTAELDARHADNCRVIAAAVQLLLQHYAPDLQRLIRDISDGDCRNGCGEIASTGGLCKRCYYQAHGRYQRTPAQRERENARRREMRAQLKCGKGLLGGRISA